MAELTNPEIVRRILSGLGIRGMKAPPNRIAEAVVPVFEVGATKNPGFWPAGDIQTDSGTKTQTLVTKGFRAASVTADTAFTVYTVTAGKKFYMTGFSASGGAISSYNWRDGGIGGTVKISHVSAANTFNWHVLTVPIEFATDVALDANTTNAAVVIGINGWEQ